MQSSVHAKRGASPCSRIVQANAEGCAACNPGKRIRHVYDQHCVMESKRCGEAQTNNPLQETKPARLDAETLEQHTYSDLDHWQSREGATRPSPELMDNVQSDITPAMRSVLVDWLGEVRDEFRLNSETLFLAVTYLDRYLVAKPVSRGQFQLLGLACLWVAAKFEEMYPPPLAAMLAMTENSYRAEDLTAMEKEVLFTLDFGLSRPTALLFLYFLLSLAPLPAEPESALSVRRLAEALLELSLLDPAFMQPRPSHVAAAAVYLALGLLGHHGGLRCVVELSGAEPAGLGVLVKRLSMVLQHAVKQPQPCAMLYRYRAWEDLHGQTVAAPAADIDSAAPTTTTTIISGTNDAQQPSELTCAGSTAKCVPEQSSNPSSHSHQHHAVQVVPVAPQSEHQVTVQMPLANQEVQHAVVELSPLPQHSQQVSQQLQQPPVRLCAVQLESQVLLASGGCPPRSRSCLRVPSCKIPSASARCIDEMIGECVSHLAGRAGDDQPPETAVRATGTRAKQQQTCSLAAPPLAATVATAAAAC